MQKYIKSYADYRQEKQEKENIASYIYIAKILFLMASGAVVYNMAIIANDAILSYFIGI